MDKRTDLTPAGFVDDLFVEGATLEVTRVGVARYAFVATTIEGSTSIDIWTTEKARILVRIGEVVGGQDWFAVRTEGEVLESLLAKQCAVHLEQLDRKQYFLGLYRGPDEIRLLLHAPGYVKARPVEKRAT